MDEELRRYFRDVADHARRVDEQVNAQRELLTSILEANLALLGVKQNEVVRAISAWAAIIAVPTFLASIWGMNFDAHARARRALGLLGRARDDGGRGRSSLHRFFRRIELALSRRRPFANAGRVAALRSTSPRRCC